MSFLRRGALAPRLGSLAFDAPRLLNLIATDLHQIRGL
jgi:hypothetical protein